MRILAQVVGGTVETKGNYPEWAYNGDSKIRELCKKVYQRKVWGRGGDHRHPCWN